MKDMKMTAAEREKQYPTAAMPEKDAEQYPYGLRVHLDESSLTKVGFSKLPEVGQTMLMQAKVKVVSVHASASENNKNSHAEFQITHLDFDRDGDADDGEKQKKLYKDK